MQDLQIFALYPSRKYLDAKIRTWVEFIREELPSALLLDGASLRQFVVPFQRVAEESPGSRTSVRI